VTLPAMAGFSAAAGIFIVAGGFVAAVDSASPFAHGAWLAAYFVLVGGISQLLLGPGRIVLGLPRPSATIRRLQLVLWNLGGIAVPAGVLVGAPGIVTVGSAALLGALACFARGIRWVTRERRAGTLAYGALILGLAMSVVIGSALADAAPGAWLVTAAITQ
jgi:hypothetical protein